jgi:hypothetical protein
MASRSSETTVTFVRPFLLAPLEAVQPAGTYRVVVDEEEILGLSFLAFRRTATMLELPALSAGQGVGQQVRVRPEDLDAALAKDGQAT